MINSNPDPQYQITLNQDQMNILMNMIAHVATKATNQTYLEDLDNPEARSHELPDITKTYEGDDASIEIPSTIGDLLDLYEVITEAPYA